MRRVPGFAIGSKPSNGSPEVCASRCRTVAPGGPAGSSRSTTPSSAATAVARAVSSLVTDAQRNSASRGPCVPAISPVRTTPAAAAAAPQSSIWRSASTARDTRGVERLNISSGSPYESVLGYSRAVRVGPHVFLAGTAPIMPGGADPPPDAYGQMRRCLEIIEAALEQAGAGLEHVVRTRVYLTRREDFEDFGRAHGEVFGE